MSPAANSSHLGRGARRAAALLLAAAAGVGAACNEDFITGPRQAAVTLDVVNWADTLVLGDPHLVRVRVRDARGHEILDVPTQMDVVAPAVLGSRLNGEGASAPRLTVQSFADSVSLAPARPGASAVVVTLLDPRFTTTEFRRTATVVVAGVRVAGARDTTLTALSDTATLAAHALARQGTGAAADYLPVPDQGVTWARRGPGAVRLVGSGDSVRVVAEAPGADTLVATHATCVAGGRCADTVVVHVAQAATPLARAAGAYRMWSLGDSVTPRVLVQDARGRAITGVRLALIPLTAADSAIVGVNTASGVPAFSRDPLAAVPTGPAFLAAPAAAPVLARAAAAPALVPSRVMIARSGATFVGPAALSAEPAAALPLVAQANGTARVAVRAVAANGTVLATDTVQVIVRQIARRVQVAPATADLTPGDSIPVQITARDARGHRIADADFQPSMAGAVWRDGRIVVPTTATPGQATLAATVVGLAQPTQHAEAAVADPAPDSSRVTVRVPAPVSAGDTATSAGNELAAVILDASHRPVAGAWVRFRVPAGALVGPDSVQTDAAGLARARWVLPTAPGVYTATAVLVSNVTPADTAGHIVLRRTETVVAGQPAALAFVTAPGATATIGAPLAPAPGIQLVDAHGNPVRLAGVAVTATAGGAAGFTLGGVPTVATDTAGRATFAQLVGAGVAGARPLTFTAGVLPALGATVTWLAGSTHASQTTVHLSAPTVASGSAVPITVTPRDAGGNPTGPGRTVTVAVPAGAPGVSSAVATAVTDQGDGTYTATLTGVRAGTPVAVQATVDGTTVPQQPTLAVTAGPVAVVAISPAVRTLTALGDTAQFTVSAADAAGNALSVAGATWTSLAPGVAGVTSSGPGGTAAALANGTARVRVALGGHADTATVTVAQQAVAITRLRGDGRHAAVATAVDTAPAVRVADANNHPIAGVPVTFAVSAGGGTVGGTSTFTVPTQGDGSAAVSAWVLGATAGANTVTASAGPAPAVAFTATGHVPPTLSVSRIERMPNGTQQFAVQSNAPGPYVWSVGGTPGGTSALGTVTGSGLYAAPAAVPTPDTVQVCAALQAAPVVRGCATVSIVATPTPGGDVIVLNDMNIVSNSANSGLEQANGAYLRPENAQFAANLIGFSGAGPRASQTRALFYLGAGSQCNAGFPCNPAASGNSLAGLVGVWAAHGYASDTTTSLAVIPANVKLVYILRPMQALANAEVNALKQFAASGGRIVVQGEWINSYTAAGVAAENAIVGALGSQLTNTGGAYLSSPGTGTYVTLTGTHQVLTGLTRLFFNATGGISTGPNDLSLAREPGNVTVLGVTKVDPTPVP